MSVPLFSFGSCAFRRAFAALCQKCLACGRIKRIFNGTVAQISQLPLIQNIKAPYLAQYNLSMDNVTGDLGEVAAGKCAGRENDDEIIVYTHMGMGALDVAVGDIIYRRAKEQGIGKVLDLS